MRTKQSSSFGAADADATSTSPFTSATVVTADTVVFAAGAACAAAAAAAASDDGGGHCMCKRRRMFAVLALAKKARVRRRWSEMARSEMPRAMTGSSRSWPMTPDISRDAGRER